MLVIFSVNYPFAECKYKLFPGFVRHVQNIWISAIRILNLQAAIMSKTRKHKKSI